MRGAAMALVVVAVASADDVAAQLLTRVCASGGGMDRPPHPSRRDFDQGGPFRRVACAGRGTAGSKGTAARTVGNWTGLVLIADCQRGAPAACSLRRKRPR